jgi:hypothetical protein
MNKSILVPRAKSRSARIQEIKQWVRDRLHLSGDAMVMVTELECNEPGCRRWRR